MKVPDISEEERAEIFTALRERKENLEKLEKKTQEASIPIDRFEERLALYRDRDELVKAEGGPTEKHLRPGLLAIFAPTPELSTEALENQTRDVNDPADLFGGGAETGGGHKAGRKQKGGFRTKNDKTGEGMNPADEVIAPPAPRAPLSLASSGTPSNNSDVIDPTALRPSAEGIADIRQATLVGEESGSMDAIDAIVETAEHAELVEAAGHARPSGRQIVDPRADARDTKMDGSAIDV